MSYSGYDIEDAIVLNRGSMDRGFGRCFVVRKFQTSIKRYNNQTSDRTCAPPSMSSAQGDDKNKVDPRLKRYQNLDRDGICEVGSVLEPGGIIINKESPLNLTESDGTTENVQYKPVPLTYRAAGAAIVDKVLITSNENENFLIKTLLRQCRRYSTHRTPIRSQVHTMNVSLTPNTLVQQQQQQQQQQ